MTIGGNVISSHSQTTTDSDEDGIRRELDKANKSRKRGAGGEKEQNTRAIKRRSRHVSENLKLNDTAIEWGDYNPDFPTSGKAGELELHDFLRRLEKVSEFAKTQADTTARLLDGLRKRTKLYILEQLKSELLHFPQNDVILLTDVQSLQDALDKPFRVPLLHRATTNHPSLGGPSTGFGIRDLLRHLAQDEIASVSVYDYSIEDPLQRTRQTTVRELLSCFTLDNVRGTALNFLDIENRTTIQFCPYQIRLQDIITKLEAQKQRDIGKTRSEWKAEPGKEFFLLSLKNAISTIHVDTGGVVTWVLILEGRKIWYFPQHVTSQTVRWLSFAGSQTPENYEHGWVKVELRSGDLLVMPPSFPHAVFTPEDCLAVGGQIYAAANLGRSIEGLKLQEDHPDISNEDLHHSVYRTLGWVLRGCDAVTTSVERAQIISSCSLFPKLSALTAHDKRSKAGLIDILKSHGVVPTPGANKNELLQLLSQVERTPREEFLEAIHSFREEFTTGG